MILIISLFSGPSSGRSCRSHFSVWQHLHGQAEAAPVLGVGLRERTPLQREDQRLGQPAALCHQGQESARKGGYHDILRRCACGG